MRSIALIALLLASLEASAQSVAFTIAGRVTSVHDGAPVVRARVTTSDPDAAVVLTDDEGRFTVPMPTRRASAAPASPSLHLTVTKGGYASLRVPIDRTRPAEPLLIAMQRGAAISGRVLDQHGQPMSRAAVQAAALADATVAGTSVTDDRGEYRIWGLPPGRYLVTAAPSMDRMLGSRGVVTLDDVLEARRTSLKPSGELELRPGDDVRAGDVFVEAADPVRVAFPQRRLPRMISGRVIGPDGGGMRDAVVRASAGPAGPGAQTTTDARGEFTIGGLATGDYVLEATARDFLVVRYGQTTLGEPPRRIPIENDDVDGIEIRLSRGHAIVGRIVDELGDPLEGVMVTLMQLRTSGERRQATFGGALSRTDDRGEYRLGRVAPGTYLISASMEARGPGGYPATYFPGTTDPALAEIITISGNGEPPRADFVVRPAPAVRVRGIAASATGVPLIGSAQINVSHRSGAIRLDPRQVPIAADGSFTLNAVPPGDYVVRVSGTPGPGGRVELGVAPVLVADGEPPPVVITTSTGTTLEGQIVFEGELPMSAPPSSRPLLSLQAYATDPDRDPGLETILPPGMEMLGVPGGQRRSTAVVSTSGTFYFTGLFGPTRLDVGGNRDGTYVKSVVVNGIETIDEPYDFGTSGGTISDARVVVSSRAPSIEGSVVDSRANPVRDYQVIAFSTSSSLWFEQSRHVATARARANGTFRIATLPPGDYWIAAVALVNDAGNRRRVEVLRDLGPSARRITLGEGESTVLSLSLSTP